MNLLDIALGERPLPAAFHAGPHRAQVIGQRAGTLGTTGVAPRGAAGYNLGVGHCFTPWNTAARSGAGIIAYSAVFFL